MKRSSPKRFPGLTWAWSGVIAASLLAGCGGAGEAEAPARPAAQVQAATNEPTGQPAPRIQSMEAIGLDSTISSQTRSLVRARLAQGQEKLFREIPLDDDTGARVFLRDDGLNGDERAGDLVFSAIATVDLESHAMTQDRIAEFQAQQSEPLTFATFDNRELVQEAKLTPLSRDAFRPGVAIPIFPAGITRAVKPAASLIITHTNVINDPTRTIDPCTGAGNPNGVWTFKHLATQMANTPLTGVDPAVFVEQWLQQTNVDQIINTWTVPRRTAMNTKILNVWPRLTNGRLDLNRAPFKLVAIVNRLDLGRGAGRVGGYGGGNSGAGELRFVFAAVDRSIGCRAYGYLDIWEYGVNKNRCHDVKAWAQGWQALSSPLLTIGSAAYNNQLQTLTQQVVMANAAPAKPNGSAINQIRRNEDMLASPWELREWELRPGPYLAEVTTDMTPHDSYNGTGDLAWFINNTPGILTNSYTIPLNHPLTGRPFLGANPQIPNPATMFWNAPGILDNNRRHKLSFNTCNGCHGRETNTNFTHISAAGTLSGFLATGMVNPNNPFWVADPVSGVNRPFWEIRDRAQHLDSVANQSCVVRGFDLPLLAVH